MNLPTNNKLINESIFKLILRKTARKKKVYTVISEIIKLSRISEIVDTQYEDENRYVTEEEFITLEDNELKKIYDERVHNEKEIARLKREEDEMADSENGILESDEILF